MKKLILLLALPLALLRFFGASSATVVIRPHAVIKQNVNGGSGVNIVYPLDNDKHYPRKVTMAAALKKMGVGCIRFSEGHLADNYLWTTPPYEDAVKGLKPGIASFHVEPAKWEWAVDKHGYFKKDLNFDDFIALCKEIGAEPIVTVNVLSFTYKGGPTKEFLINSAKEWVRYANVVRNYGVKYWQLGNEVEKYDNEKERNPERERFLLEILDQEGYCNVFGQMAKAMKEIDPAIKVGTGVMGKPSWNQAILEKFPDLVSFISCHQYAWGANFCERGYESWSEHQGVHIPNIVKMQKLLDSNPAWKDIEIVITETGSTGGSWPEKLEGEKNNSARYTNDLYKALNNWEMNTAQLASPSVKYTTFWCTRTPWRGGDSAPPGLEAQLNRDNMPTATGSVTLLINNYMLPEMLDVNYVEGNLRMRASTSMDREVVTFFVLNKGKKTEQVDFSVASDKAYTLVERVEFSGKSPNDANPTIKKSALNSKEKSHSAKVPPCSLTIFSMEKNTN